MYNYNYEANPQPDEHIWTRDGKPLVSGGKTTLTANSITITDVNRSDSGVYTIFSSNVAGNGSANFILNVYCEWQFSYLIKVLHVLYIIIISIIIVPMHTTDV